MKQNNNLQSIHIFIFLIGFISGMCFIFGMIKYDFDQVDMPSTAASFFYSKYSERSEEEILEPTKMQEKHPKIYAKPLVDGEVHDEHKHVENAVTKTLYDSVKVLCLINTSVRQIENRAIHVNATWAKRCNKYLFLSYHENITLPFLDLEVPELRANLWDKMRALFKWVLKNEIDNYDFFLKADDDSYFIMENLRLMLLPYDPNTALYFGSRFKMFVKKGYMSGGAGYILSREAVKQLVPAFDDPKLCPQENGDKEDVKIGTCMANLGIDCVDTRDNAGRHRMLPFSPVDHLVKGLRSRHFQYLYYPYYHQKDNETMEYKCCADHMISFHYINRDMLYYFEFLIYHAKPIGFVDDLWVNAEESGKAEGMTILETLKNAAIDYTFNTTLIS